MMKLKKIVTIILSLIFFAAIIIYSKREVDIDKCLDNGGRWNYEHNMCEYS